MVQNHNLTMKFYLLVISA